MKQMLKENKKEVIIIGIILGIFILIITGIAVAVAIMTPKINIELQNDHLQSCCLQNNGSWYSDSRECLELYTKEQKSNYNDCINYANKK